jgi:hypothetical protein
VDLDILRKESGKSQCYQQHVWCHSNALCTSWL